MQVLPYAIFDMDGTLLDSMPMWDEVDSVLFARHGIEETPAIKQAVKTMDLRQTGRYLREELGVRITDEQLEREIRQIVQKAYETRLPLKPGAAQYLQALADRGVVLAVLSASQPDHIKAALTRNGVLHLFCQCLCSGELGIEKSKPEVFKEAARRLGTQAENCQVYEDSLHAILAAKEAGCKVVGVYEACAPADQPAIKASAHRYIHSFWEALEELP